MPGALCHVNGTVTMAAGHSVWGLPQRSTYREDGRHNGIANHAHSAHRSTNHTTCFSVDNRGWGFALGREGELGRGSSALEFTRVRGTAHLAACAQRAVTAHRQALPSSEERCTKVSVKMGQPLADYDEYDDRLKISNAPFSERTGRGQQMGLRGQYMRLFWRSSHDTFQYLVSHVRGDLGRALRLGTLD